MAKLMNWYDFGCVRLACFFVTKRVIWRSKNLLLYPNITMANIPRSEVLTALTQYYEEGDLSFIETVNNITFGYKATMRKQGINNLTSTYHDKQKE